MAFVVYTCLKKMFWRFCFGVISGAKIYFSHKLGLTLKVTPVMDYCVF